MKKIFSVFCFVVLFNSGLALANTGPQVNRYCIFDLYGSWGAWATSAETVCSTGFSFNSGAHFASVSAANQNLQMAKIELAKQGFEQVQNFEAIKNPIYWEMLTVFKKPGNSKYKEVCFIGSYKNRLLGCTSGTQVMVSPVAEKSPEENLFANGFIQTGIIPKINLSQGQIKVYER